MEVPINPLIEMALDMPVEEGSISWKIEYASKLSSELRRLERYFEEEDKPSDYVISKAKKIIDELKPLMDEIDEFKKNSPFFLVQY